MNSGVSICENTLRYVFQTRLEFGNIYLIAVLKGCIDSFHN